jgi:GntR family transcriptional regulator/MocR family aminotransferase
VVEGSNSDSATIDQGGSDFLQLHMDAALHGGRADWLARQLRVAIADGRLAVGARLPASRILAQDLNVSRGVVTQAYQRLTDDGHLSGLGRRGTVVIAGPAAGGRVVPDGARTLAPGPAPRPADLFADDVDNAAFAALRSAAGRIDLTPGAPDLAAFPRAGWLRAERAVLSGMSAGAFGYPDPAGAPAFRRSMASWLARNRGISVEPADLIVVAGVAQALALLARVLLAEGVDRVAVEDPGSRGAREQLRSWGLMTPPVQVDSAGVRVDELAALGAPAVLLTPAHQFPTGVVLDGGRRRQLLAWAGAGGLIIEDDYDAEHRYDRPPTAALHAMAPDQVCYAGSVSKLLAPALRIGWLIVPPRYRAAIVAGKRESDLGNAVLPQLVLAHMFDNGEMERHLRLVRRRHRARRDAMVGALRRELPSASIHGAAAGLHLTITLDGDGSSDIEVAVAALAAGVKVHPLSWHRQRPGPAGFVLGYAASNATEITEGISTLARVHREVAATGLA